MSYLGSSCSRFAGPARFRVPRPTRLTFAPAARLERLESRDLFAAPPLDPTFGVGGKGRYDTAGLSDRFEVVYPLPDGRILVGGESIFALTVDVPVELHPSVRFDTRGVLMRLGRDGTPDATFGDGGTARHHSDPFAYVPPAGQHLVARINSITTLAVQPDGKILAGGSAFLWTASTDGLFIPDDAFAVARYNVDGTVDTTFGSNGIALADMIPNPDGSAERVTAMALTPDGRIVVAGHLSRTIGPVDTDVGIARFNTDGSVDESFGRRVIDLSNSETRQTDAVTALLLQPDGKLVLGGATGGFDGSQHFSSFALLRLNSDGTRDGSFGSAGNVVTNFPQVPDSLDLRGRNGGGGIHHLVLQSDSKIVAVGGVASGHLALARYNPDGTLDATFGIGSTVATRAVLSARYRGKIDSAGTLHVTGVGNGTFLERGAGESGLDIIGHDTGIEVFAARFTSAGMLIEQAHFERVPMSGTEKALAVVVQADGGILAVGSANPITFDPANQNPTYEQATDALAVRFDPSLMPWSPSARQNDVRADQVVADGSFGGILQTIPTVRGGRALKFRMTWQDLESARPSLNVTGPNGFAAVAEGGKVKFRKRANAAVATYRVDAPGGRFDLPDNGTYTVAGNPVVVSTTLTLPGHVYGRFTVDSRRPAPRAGAPARGASTLRRLLVTDLLRDNPSGG